MAASSTVARHTPPVIGIVGGVGSGKSTLARWVAGQHPVIVVDADRLGHRALQQPAVIAGLRAAFGDGVLTPDQQIDRQSVARLVFGTEPETVGRRRTLNQLVHPAIATLIDEELATRCTAETIAVLLDAAVLFEAGWHSRCAAVIYIDTPLERRRAWVAEHRGWSEAELERREQSQLSGLDKQRLANAVVANDGTIAEGGLRLWEAIRRCLTTR